jgi:hypothetical protein
MEDISTKAYAQWVVINITNSSSKPVVVKNVHLSWGKFHKDGKSPASSARVMVPSRHLDHNACIDNKDAEIPAKDIENTKILPGDTFRINSCGREDASSGTEGDFDLYEDGGPKVRHFYWDCPWGTKTNTWTISGTKDPLGVHSPEQLDSRNT